MEALDRIATHDWPALQAWARLQDEPVEVTAATFEDDRRVDIPDQRGTEDGRPSHRDPNRNGP
jgi:hypothetical protein